MIGPSDTLPTQDTPPVETSDEFVPELSHVYELVDQAEDRLAAQITQRFDELEARLFSAFNPETNQGGALSVLLAQNMWLGENVIPLLTSLLKDTSGLHEKFDAVISDVRGFVSMVQSSGNPFVRRMLRGKGGDQNATQAEEGDSAAG